MGATRVEEIADRLIAAGRAPETPVAAVRNGTRPDQQTVRATLGTIADAEVRAPSAIVVGDVAALDLAWFEDRPLFGRRIVVTRAREQASELRARLESLGAEVLELPAIRIEPIDVALPDLEEYAWLVCTSVNGVRALFERGLAPLGHDARALGRLRVAAIGPGTAAAFAARGITPDLVPERYVAEALVEAFPAPEAPGDRVLLGTRRGRPRRAARWAWRRAATPSRCFRCTARCRRSPRSRCSTTVRDGQVDAITFTSSSTVTGFCDLVGTLPDPQPTVVSIGPVTSETARARGLRVDAEADEHTIDGVVTALLLRLSP